MPNNKRTNTAQWFSKYKYWKVTAQKDGVRKQFYSNLPGRPGQREANAKADKWLDGGTAVNTRASALLSDFLETEQKTSLSQYKKAEGIIRLYISPVIGQKRIDRVTFDDYQEIIDNAVDKGLAAKTISNIRSIVSQFAKYCRRKKVSEVRTDDLDLSGGKRRLKKRILQPVSVAVLFTVDTCRLKGTVVYDKYINAYRMMVATGLRPGELTGLQWSDIHGDTIYLQRAVNVYGEVTRGKNDNAVRPVPITQIARRILEDQWQATGKSVGYIFDIQSQSTLRHRWHNYCTSNNIPYCSLYELRHTFVSLSSGIPEGQLKQIVGHSQNMDTFGVYGHLVDGQLEDTGHRIDAVFDKILEPKK